MPLSSRSHFSKILTHIGAFCGAMLVASLAACSTAAPPDSSYARAEQQTPQHQQMMPRRDLSGAYTLPNLGYSKAPVRIGLILPFSAKSASVQHLSEGLLNAAQMAIYDGGKKNILLMSADSHGTAAGAETAARKLLSQGAEVIVGPLFATSVAAITPIARRQGVPVIAFSTDRKVAGAGIYLMSYQPENEIRRVISYARGHGLKRFGALIPQSAYGRVAAKAFRADVAKAGGTLTDVEFFNPASGQVNMQARKVAQSMPGAIFLPQAGSVLNTMTSVLAFNGAAPDKVKYLGTGIWNQPATQQNSLLKDAWFAAPTPELRKDFNASYHDTFGEDAPTLASLSYDAVSLVTLLADGQPGQRFSEAAITDPNGFTGVSGLFRFRQNGTIERALAVMSVAPDGFKIISPAVKSFTTDVPKS